MHVYQALDVINQWKPNQVETLSDLLPIELINEAYLLTDTVTLRKRKFPQCQNSCNVNLNKFS